MTKRDERVAAEVADPAAFSEWVRPHLTHVAHLVGRMAPWAERDDLTQEALFRAWRMRHTYDPLRGTPSTWLLAIAANVALKARRVRIFGRMPPDLASAGVEEASAKRLDIERALKHLSPRQRLAIECYYFVDLGIAEIAAVMGCSEGTVKSTLADARAKLRQLLEVVE
ncbi:RNA polymerase sigma factor [Micromonospora saelicesensis]|uniref:RNA polymerase sigma factor n=1 Tax=Micromonospora saelicesensis TaxID=285676 RepID=UPI003CFA2B3E